MWRVIPALCVAAAVAAPVAAQPLPAAPSYELRTYYAAPGRLSELHARFRAHNLPLLQRHGAEVVGTWVPKPNPDNAVVVLLAYPNGNREGVWARVVADPQWAAMKQAADRRGLLVQDIGELPLAAATALRKTSAEGDLELRTHPKPEAVPGAIGAWVPTRPNRGIGMVSLHPRRPDELASRSAMLVSLVQAAEPAEGSPRVTVLSPTDYSPLK